MLGNDDPDYHMDALEKRDTLLDNLKKRVRLVMERRECDGMLQTQVFNRMLALAENVTVTKASTAPAHASNLAPTLKKSASHRASEHAPVISLGGAALCEATSAPIDDGQRMIDSTTINVHVEGLAAQTENVPTLHSV